jgi:hypothetical protein
MHKGRLSKKIIDNCQLLLGYMVFNFIYLFIYLFLGFSVLYHKPV